MPSYLAVYNGPTVPESEVVAVTTDPDLVSHVAAHILAGRNTTPDTEAQQRRHHLLQRIAAWSQPASGFTFSPAPLQTSRAKNTPTGANGEKTMPTAEAPTRATTVADDWLTVADMSRELGVSTQRIYQLIADCRLPHVRLSPYKIRCSRKAWDKWLKGLDTAALNAAQGHGEAAHE